MASPLREILPWPMGARYGPLPMVPLPQDDEVLLGVIEACADILRDKGIYRRDNIVVIPYEQRRRLMMMEAKMFCSWVLHFLMPTRTKWDKDGEPFTVCKDMPTEVAEKVLLSMDFWPALPEIEAVHAAPMPVIREDGTLALLGEGYDSETRTLTFAFK